MNDARTLPSTTQILQRGIDSSLHLGGQMYVSQHGKTIADFAFGESRPGKTMQTGDLMLWMSASKPIVAVAVGMLVDRGLVSFDDPVANFVPEFAVHGKEIITLRHILTHTAGIRGVALEWTALPYETIVEQVCNVRIENNWIVGEKAGYHIAGSWYGLTEVVRRVDGRRFEQFARDMIYEPLGMNDSWMGMPAEKYREYGERIVPPFDTKNGSAVEWTFAQSEPACTICRPGGGGRGPIRELGRFYEAMLVPGQLLSEATLHQMTTPQRVGMYDVTFRHVMDWGLGFITNSAKYGSDTVPYGFGQHASDATFGHGGSQSVCSFADPKHRLAVAWACNGMPGEVKHNARVREINAAIYEDLGLGKGNA